MKTSVTNKHLTHLLHNRRKLSSEEMRQILTCTDTELFEALKNTAAKIKLCNFGRTVRIYRPVYLSNYCVNDCLYCGCASSIKSPRKILSIDEIKAEISAVKKDGIDSVLIVAGEDKKNCSPEYLAESVSLMKESFSFVALEVGTLEPDECKLMLQAGADSFVLYQETYDEARYNLLHKGTKKNFRKRFEAIDIAASAGFKSVGMGILLGIADWVSDAIALAKHAQKFRKKFWDVSLSFSFPRLRPPADNKFPEYKVSEDQLLQIMLLFRILFDDAEINISTRESASFRDQAVKYCATTMSAASGTYPGAYSMPAESENALRQFEIEDNRTVAEICRAVEKNNLQPVFKYWDRVINSYI